MQNNDFQIFEGNSPILAVANHHSHFMRTELAELCQLEDMARLREEDPFTNEWTKVTPNVLLTQRSRFEIDLNRSRETAFYLEPNDAWGLNIWKEKPTPEMIQRSLDYYDTFYQKLKIQLTKLKDRYGHFVVLDLHSYNHRRNGPEAPPEDPEKNPEVNIGTGTMIRSRWSHLVDRFIQDLKNFDFLGRSLDVRENIKFVGRQLPQWVHENFPETGCALAIEFKKFFMDEWNGQPDWTQIKEIEKALNSTLPGLTHELKRCE